MAFQFYCPQGHLLEGDERQAGQQCACPYCQTMFVIPGPVAAPPAAAPPGYGPSAPSPGMYGPPGYGAPANYSAPANNSGGAPAAPGGFPAVGPAAETPNQFAQVGAAPEAPVAAAPAPDPNRVIHILCPEGHVLPTPMSMVGQDAMCPHCNSLFRLRYEDSQEAAEDRRLEQERREAKFSENALKWAIVCAVLVGVGLIGMVIVMMQ